ncbi:hypothetical protein D9613_008746 [Agrocybe pediades]|uniref:F-box domain-containing protein n=1 Tax=Agrocybe pediades TaxID=84607 RepID=A0A8H4VNV1_9AGAR|nr:hypothetical protein D9613_008746 [Agrocybe pediades]
MDGAHSAVHGSVRPTPWWEDEDHGFRAPDLPPELHALILNELDGENTVLKQCALTCKLYKPLAQKLLFKEVVFEFSHDFNPADNFLDILKASPQIACYVKRLFIRETGYLVRGTGQTQTQLDKSIPVVIPALINLVDLVMGREMQTFHFSHLNPSSQLAITGKCASLLSLTLINIDGVPLRIFNHLHNLEEFIVDVVSFTDNHDDEAVRELSSCRIKHMKLADAWIGDMSIYPFLVERRFCAANLESLILNMNRNGWVALSPTDFEAAKWLIRSNSASLKVLDVTISGNVPVILYNDEAIFDLFKMPLLEEWSLGGVVCNTETGRVTGPIGLGWLARHLETIPAGRRFKSVILRPAILGAACVMDNSLDFEGFKYLESLIVDKVLSTTDFFAIHFKVWDQYETKPAKEQMQKYLPTLHSLGLLHFEEY